MPRTPEQIAPVRKMVENKFLRAQLWVIKNGIPFDVAFALNEKELEAYTIIFQEFEGREYSFDYDAWIEREQT